MGERPAGSCAFGPARALAILAADRLASFEKVAPRSRLVLRGRCANAGSAEMGAVTALADPAEISRPPGWTTHRPASANLRHLQTAGDGSM